MSETPSPNIKSGSPANPAVVAPAVVDPAAVALSSATVTAEENIKGFTFIEAIIALKNLVVGTAQKIHNLPDGWAKKPVASAKDSTLDFLGKPSVGIPLAVLAGAALLNQAAKSGAQHGSDQQAAATTAIVEKAVTARTSQANAARTLAAVNVAVGKQIAADQTVLTAALEHQKHADAAKASSYAQKTSLMLLKPTKKGAQASAATVKESLSEKSFLQALEEQKATPAPVAAPGHRK